MKRWIRSVKASARSKKKRISKSVFPLACSRKNSCVKCVKQVRRGHIAIWKRPEGISRKSARRTHDQKIETLKAAVAAGLSICSGGIMGLGETLEDRVDMVLTAKELGVKSVPVNFLNPIPGTPYEDNKPLTDEEARQCVAVFRFIIPDASIRLAGGRGLLDDKGKECFQSGANAAISGDMLTTAGITVQKDMEMLKDLGYKPQLWED